MARRLPAGHGTLRPGRQRAGAESAVATRYDQRAIRHEATVLVAALSEWL
ncbi:hypothetical protein [Streptomyces sp. NPDC047043]